MQGSSEGKYKLSALKISAVAIFSVVVVEVSIGWYVNSLAIMSDGLHALLDALTSVMLFFAVRAAMKPADEEHTYGHEKFETIGGLIGGIVLIAVAVLIFYEAANRLLSNTQIVQSAEYAGFVAIGYALFVASLRVTVFRKFEHVESQSMKAGLYDAIADLSSTLIALVGFGLALLGFAGADAFASIFLGTMLTYLSLKLVKVSVMELSDTASKDLVVKTKKIILSCQGVVKTESLKVRKVGSKVFVDAAIKVPREMSLEEAHSLASRIEGCLKDAFGNTDATIHIEPAEKETEIDNLVKKLAAEEGATEVHEISTVYLGGKLYITLHICVNPEFSVEEAHRIAENIERRMHAEIKSLENVTVHMEPSGVSVPAAEVSEEQLTKIANEVAKGIERSLQIKRVVTYLAEGKRYINIDCCFTKQVNVKEAHRLASLVEKETKERFADALVTVHVEPECTDQQQGAP
jgi:cation diffusion facilitator family transporter